MKLWNGRRISKVEKERGAKDYIRAQEADWIGLVGICYSKKPEGEGLSEARQRVRSWVLRLNWIGLGSYEWNGIGKQPLYATMLQFGFRKIGSLLSGPISCIEANIHFYSFFQFAPPQMDFAVDRVP